VTTPGQDPDEPPPVLGTWRKLYGLVLLVLAVLIALFYALTRWAS
jgi:hypothetical protein